MTDRPERSEACEREREIRLIDPRLKTCGDTIAEYKIRKQQKKLEEDPRSETRPELGHAKGRLPRGSNERSAFHLASSS